MANSFCFLFFSLLKAAIRRAAQRTQPWRLMGVTADVGTPPFRLRVLVPPTPRRRTRSSPPGRAISHRCFQVAHAVPQNHQPTDCQTRSSHTRFAAFSVWCCTGHPPSRTGLLGGSWRSSSAAARRTRTTILNIGHVYTSFTIARNGRRVHLR